MRGPQSGMFSLSSIALTCMISIVPLLLVTQLSAHARGVRRALIELESTVAMQQTISSVISDYESLGVSLEPRVQPHGTLTLTNGDLVLPSRQTELLPDRLSDALSWGTTDFTSTLMVTGTDPPAWYDACFVFHSRWRIGEEIDSYFAITRDGLYEMNEITPHATRTADCLRLNLKSTESMLGDPTETFLASGTILLIPVTAISTLFRDGSGGLRKITHRGTAIASNQPVRDSIHPFRLAKHPDSAGATVYRVDFLPLGAHTAFTYRQPVHVPPSGFLTVAGNLICHSGRPGC